MSEERFDGIDRRFDDVDHRFDDVDRRFDDVDRRFVEVDRRFVEVDRRFDDVDRRFVEVDRRFDLVDADIKVLQSDVTELKVETIDLRRHMGVLHEDVIDRIRGIREDDSLRQEMRAGFAMIMRRLDDHAIPGEAADRTFAATLADHEKRITSLERTKS